MSDPVAFPSATPVLGLPLLITGQAQKEFFINQALCLLDALAARTVISSRTAPPEDPVEGTCFRVLAPADEAWNGQEDSIAMLIGGAWHHMKPRHGMQVFDQEAGQFLTFRAGWVRALAPAEPSGGPVVDIEARLAIGTLIQALRTIGVIGANSS